MNDEAVALLRYRMGFLLRSLQSKLQDDDAHIESAVRVVLGDYCAGKVNPERKLMGIRNRLQERINWAIAAGHSNAHNVLARYANKLDRLIADFPEGWCSEGEARKVGAGGTAPREPMQAVTITTNRLKTRSNPLDAIVELATSKAVAPDDSQSVYAEMVKLAELTDRPAPLHGYAPEGIQYRGKKYEEKGEPDTFTLKNLRDRMARAKAR